MRTKLCVLSLLLGLLLAGGCQRGAQSLPQPVATRPNTTDSIPSGNGQLENHQAVPRTPSAPETTLLADATPVHDRPIAQAADGFVGSSVCRECHETQFHSWYHSYHRTMTQVASEESVLGDFQNRTVTASGVSFELTKKDGRHWIEAACFAEPRLIDKGKSLHEDDPGDERASTRVPIAMTTGSHHMQVYWYPLGDDRSLGQVPIAWLKETQSWVPTSSLFLSPPGQPLSLGPRRWNETCIKCHTTAGQPRIEDIDNDSPRVDSQVAEFGISCEACHGPGQHHVFASQAGEPTDPHIVHPAKLDHARSSEVCGQCHGNWIPDSETEIDNFLAKGTCFRAGDSLSDARHVFEVESTTTPFIEQFLRAKPHYLEDRYWSDGKIRVSGGEYNGMVQSKCFQAGELSCLSCHQLHQAPEDTRGIQEWANDQLRHDRAGQGVCLVCHTEFKSPDAQTQHSHHPLGSSGNDCMNCHMPHTSYGLLKAMRSHTISSPSVQESLQHGRPNACNQCHLDETLAWTGEYLQAWYEIEPPHDLTDDDRNVSAAVLWALRGDAGQRALAAWTLGWKPAQEVSEMHGAPAVLAQLLADPYDAVRHISHRSLKTLTGFDDFEFNYVGGSPEQQAGAVKAFRIWQRQEKKSSPKNQRLLLTPSGTLNASDFSRLNHQRNNRQVLLAE